MYYLRQNKPVVLAVVLSLVIIASTYWYVQHKKSNEASEEVDVSKLIGTIPSIQINDHVLGNPKAPIIFYVYSDFSCPYCADYHQVIRKIMQIFGTDSKVAIVFRHMPLVQLHPEAPMYALASECIAEELGNAGFWSFADMIFKKHDPLKPLSPADLVIEAEKLGASRQAFVTCMRSNELMSIVDTQFNEGVNGGAEGSPFTIIEALGDRAEYQGSQSYRTIAITIQTLLRKVDVYGNDNTATEHADVNIANEFEKIDISSEAPNATSTPVATSTRANSTSTQNKNPSILDGIL